MRNRNKKISGLYRQTVEIASENEGFKYTVFGVDGLAELQGDDDCAPPDMTEVSSQFEAEQEGKEMMCNVGEALGMKSILALHLT